MKEGVGESASSGENRNGTRVVRVGWGDGIDESFILDWREGKEEKRLPHPRSDFFPKKFPRP